MNYKELGAFIETFALWGRSYTNYSNYLILMVSPFCTPRGGATTSAHYMIHFAEVPRIGSTTVFLRRCPLVCQILK